MKLKIHRPGFAMRFSKTLCALMLVCFAAADFAAAAKKDPTDVTAAVAAAVKDESLSIASNNSVFGDTANGVPKKLRVEYHFGGEKLSKEVPEGGQLEISAPAGKHLVITKAIYGPADGSKPPVAGALTDDPGELLDTLPGFKVTHVLQANAAKQGSWICMAKDPKGRLLLGGQQNQPITRVTLQDGKSVKEEILHIPVTEACFISMATAARDSRCIAARTPRAMTAMMMWNSFASGAGDLENTGLTRSCRDRTKCSMPSVEILPKCPRT